MLSLTHPGAVLHPLTISSQWESDEGAKIAHLMKKEHREDFGVLGLRSNLDTMEEWLGTQKLKGHLAVFR